MRPAFGLAVASDVWAAKQEVENQSAVPGICYKMAGFPHFGVRHERSIHHPHFWKTTMTDRYRWYSNSPLLYGPTRFNVFHWLQSPILVAKKINGESSERQEIFSDVD